MPSAASVKVVRKPLQGQWALPGGFVDENEPLDKAAARELQEETSVDPKDVLLTQVSNVNKSLALEVMCGRGRKLEDFDRNVRTRQQAYDSSRTGCHAGCLAAEKRALCLLLILCCSFGTSCLQPCGRAGCPRKTACRRQKSNSWNL